MKVSGEKSGENPQRNAPGDAAIYQKLAEICSDAVITFDEEGKILSANPATEKIFGCTIAETLGHEFTLLIPEYLSYFRRATLETHLETRQRGASAAHFETFGLHKNGKEISLETAFAELTINGKRVFAAFARDVSERKRTEAALRESSEFNKQIISSAREGIIVYDRQLRCVTWNPFMEELTGLRAEQVLGKSPLEIFRVLDKEGSVSLPEGTTHEIYDSLKRALAGETLNLPDIPRIFHEASEVGWSAGRYATLRNAQGEIIGVIATVWDITQRKQAEEELRESEERFRSLFEDAPVAYHEIDTQGIVRRVNRAECGLLGLEVSEILGKRVWDFVADEEHEICQEVIRRKMAGEQPLSPFQREYIRRDGSRRIFEIYENLIRDKAGTVLGVRSAMLDVTERARTEQALAASEVRYRLLFDRHLAGVYLATHAGQILECNGAFARIFGYSSRTELLAHTVWDLYFDPADHGTVITKLKEKRSLSGVEVRCRRKDGKPVWVLASLSLIPCEDGKQSMLQGTVVDITERKRAEEALRASEVRFRRLVDSNIIGVITTDYAGRIVDANDAFLQMIGYTREDLVAGRLRWDQMTPPEYRPLDERATEELRKSGVCAPWEKEYLRKDGSRVPVLIAVALLEPDQGNSICIVLDITERKRAEESLRQLSGRLLHLQDQERRGIARELHDSTGQSLAALAMNLSRLQEMAFKFDSETQKIVSDSLALAEQCSREVRTLSYLLHPPLLDELGLAAALRWYVDGFRGRSGIRVDLDLPPELGRLTPDIETTLFRIVQESLTNVHRHSESPTARIRILKGPQEVRLEVKDEGRGLSPGPLERAGVGIMALGVGIAGMGERVRQLGGWLDIESGKRGTTVRAVLPLEKGDS